jgi:hypothetical protein
MRAGITPSSASALPVAVGSTTATPSAVVFHEGGQAIRRHRSWGWGSIEIGGST